MPICEWVRNTQNLSVAERPNFFAKLMAQISSLRTSTGRPHWLLIDEAHHLVPASRNDVSRTLPEEIPAAIFITLHPEALSPGALKTAGVVIALGRGAPDSARGELANACGRDRVAEVKGRVSANSLNQERPTCEYNQF